MKLSLFHRLLMVILVFAIIAPSAFAKGSADYTEFGHDIRIRADQNAGELTCFNCSVYVQGQVNGNITTFHGNIVIEQNAAVSGEVTSFLGQIRAASGSKIGGNATVFAGNIVLDQDGMVSGEATAIAGDIRVANGAKIGGDSTAIGGAVRRQAGAMMGGEVTSMQGTIWLLLIFVAPFMFLAGILALIIWLVRRNRRPTPAIARAA
jgi:cytoskeletal protein CcmA (bactofilin family)